MRRVSTAAVPPAKHDAVSEGRAAVTQTAARGAAMRRRRCAVLTQQRRFVATVCATSTKPTSTAAVSCAALLA